MSDAEGIVSEWLSEGKGYGSKYLRTNEEAAGTGPLTGVYRCWLYLTAAAAWLYWTAAAAAWLYWVGP